MGYYSIKDLEKISGVKAHTLRAWELRYGILEPKRTSTNIRYYTELDLRLLLNVATLNNNGYRISKIAKMSDQEIHHAVVELTDNGSENQNQVNALLLAMIEVDERRFEQVITTNILRLGFEPTVNEIVYPFFEKIGILWQTGSVTPAQEHFISNLVRQKLIVAIDGQPNQKRDGCQTWMLFTPEGEHHEIGLLFASYVLRSRGHEVIYLGANLPMEDMASIIKVKQPDMLLTVLTTQVFNYTVKEYFEELKGAYPDLPVVAGGQAVKENVEELPHGVTFYPNVQSLIDRLDR